MADGEVLPPAHFADQATRGTKILTIRRNPKSRGRRGREIRQCIVWAKNPGFFANRTPYICGGDIGRNQHS